MKKVKSIFMKPTILLGIAAVLLLGSGVGSARAALTYYSDQYSASMDMSTIGVYRSFCDRLFPERSLDSGL